MELSHSDKTQGCRSRTFTPRNEWIEIVQALRIYKFISLYLRRTADLSSQSGSSFNTESQFKSPQSFLVPEIVPLSNGEKKTSFTATTERRCVLAEMKKENLRFQERKSVNLISTEAWNWTASDFPKLQGFSSSSGEWFSLHKIMYTVWIQTRRTFMSKVYI